jgi:hypothetical protein
MGQILLRPDPFLTHFITHALVRDNAMSDSFLEEASHDKHSNARQWM